MKLVSCIMPTRGRQALALKAVHCFNAQTYTPRELVILDDDDNPSFPLGVKGKAIQYHRMPTRMTIAQKRNECCRLAKGEYIVHWDSDDWNAPERIADQVKMLDAGMVRVVGYNTLLFYDERIKQAYLFERERRYALGTSLAYYKSFWQTCSFREGLNGELWGEDNQFGDAARKYTDIDTVEGRSMIVARIHDDITSPKNVDLGPRDVSLGSWRALPVEAIPHGFFQ